MQEVRRVESVARALVDDIISSPGDASLRGILADAMEEYPFLDERCKPLMASLRCKSGWWSLEWYRSAAYTPPRSGELPSLSPSWRLYWNPVLKKDRVPDGRVSVWGLGREVKCSGFPPPSISLSTGKIISECTLPCRRLEARSCTEWRWLCKGCLLAARRERQARDAARRIMQPRPGMHLPRVPPVEEVEPDRVMPFHDYRGVGGQLIPSRPARLRPLEPVTFEIPLQGDARETQALFTIVAPGGEVREVLP